MKISNRTVLLLHAGIDMLIPTSFLVLPGGLNSDSQFFWWCLAMAALIVGVLTVSERHGFTRPFQSIISKVYFWASTIFISIILTLLALFILLYLMFGWMGGQLTI